jgi:glycine/D-amino acid oxidase-like deaminating enzyme
MRVAVVDSGAICREASGVNAGTLTMHMTRAALIPYALEGWRMWQEAQSWLGASLDVQAVDGVTVAFTQREAEMLEQRARVRREAGAPIHVISPERARELEPGLSDRVVLAASCAVDGFNSPYLLGRAFKAALSEAGVTVHEYQRVSAVDRVEDGFRVRAAGAALAADRLVLAGGVWLEEMLSWVRVHLPVRFLINQLVVTERIPAVMRTVCSVASGLLSLKQFANGTVLIGGGWQGEGDRDSRRTKIRPESFIGNVRLASYTIPALSHARVVRSWLGFEAETADALPIIGDVPGVPGAYVIGSVHSGYTSGPYMGRLLAQYMTTGDAELPLFDPARLLQAPALEKGANP